MLFRILHENGKMPSKETANAAGYDVSSRIDCTIPPYGYYPVPTGVGIEPNRGGEYVEVHGRSGLAYRYGIHTHVGIVDEDYEGDIHVILFNPTGEAFPIKMGERIGQLIVKESIPADNGVIKDKERGANGFGHTGM